MAETLNALLSERARERGAKTFLYFKDQEVSFLELEELANRTAHELIALGVRKGDHVGLMLPNCPEFLYHFFAVMKAGAVAVPVNGALKTPEVAYILGNAGAKGLVLGSAFSAAAEALRRECPGLGWIRTVPEARPKGEVASALEGRPAGPPEVRVAPGDRASLIYTSGTTGFPKGAVLTHRNYLFDVERFATGIIKEDDRFLCFLPLFHVNGQVVTTLGPLFMGASMILMERFTPKEFFSALARRRATAFSGVPAVYGVLLNLPESESFALGSLRFCICGAAPMPVEVFKRFEEKFKAFILEGYGLSEGTCVSSVNPVGGERKIGSIGLPIPGQEMKVVDDQGGDLPPNRVGEIVIRGENVMQGYHNNPEATAEALRGGWLHTGDLAYADEDGYFFIVGRKKEMIIRGGENIYPVEIEEVLYRHPAVAEAAVIGLPDKRWGEEVAAFVVLREGRTPTPRELLEHCRASLADYKCPRRIELVEGLPKTATGKIQKLKFREAYLGKAGTTRDP